MAVSETSFSLQIQNPAYPGLIHIGTAGSGKIPTSVSWSASTWISESYAGAGYRSVTVSLVVDN